MTSNDGEQSRQMLPQKSNLFRWRLGRQGTGYHKMFLGGGYWPLPFDIYLLKFLTGHAIPPHIDKVESGKHFRLNIVLKPAKEGGQFVCQESLYENRVIKYFRSDISEHAVTEVKKGTRYVLSIGWVKGS